MGLVGQVVLEVLGVLEVLVGRYTQEFLLVPLPLGVPCILGLLEVQVVLGILGVQELVEVVGMVVVVGVVEVVRMALQFQHNQMEEVEPRSHIFSSQCLKYNQQLIKHTFVSLNAL